MSVVKIRTYRESNKTAPQNKTNKGTKERNKRGGKEPLSCIQIMNNYRGAGNWSWKVQPDNGTNPQINIEAIGRKGGDF